MTRGLQRSVLLERLLLRPSDAHQPEPAFSADRLPSTVIIDEMDGYRANHTKKMRYPVILTRSRAQGLRFAQGIPLRIDTKYVAPFVSSSNTHIVQVVFILK